MRRRGIRAAEQDQRESKSPRAETSRWHWRRGYWTVIELVLIGLWAMYVGRAFLNLGPHIIPPGNEFGMLNRSNHVWTQIQKCGWCALWDGSEQGGLPALVDVQGSMLHPIIAVTTLLFGVVDGVKLTLVVALWLAGVAQWWIGRELNVGVIARLFTAGIAVAGGHLAAKMHSGDSPLVLSTAMASLFLAAVLHFGRRGDRRAAVLLGILLASLLLSGNGYMQLATIGVLPAAIFLLISLPPSARSAWKGALLALGLGLLISAPLLVPLAHFSPEFSKGTDPGAFQAAQPLQYIPLNLVIRDPAFYDNQTLGKLPSVDLYGLFVGWTPVVLAVIGACTVPRRDRRAGWFLASGVALAFFIASAIPSRAIAKYWPSSVNSPLVGGFRYPSVAAALAVPLILGFAAWGVQYIWRLGQEWPSLALTGSERGAASRLRLPLQWLLVIPLIYSLGEAWSFSHSWYNTVQQNPAIPDVVGLKTDTLQWVQPPPNVGFIEPAVAAGLKISPGIGGTVGVQWKGREYPKPSLIASSEGAPPESISQVRQVGAVGIYATDAVYAGIQTGQTIVPCTATGSGGYIVVSCEAGDAGRLVVQESMWTGWNAWLDGRPTALLSAQWLEVDAPAGRHTYTFEYLPWDVPLGLSLFVVGIALAAWLWWRPIGNILT